MQLAALRFEKHVDAAWQDFNMNDLLVAFVDRSTEDKIFVPYFLFDWDPDRRTRGRRLAEKGGVILRWYKLEKSGGFSQSEPLLVEQAVTRPLSFYEVLWTKPGEQMALRDLLIGAEHEVIERSASRTLRQGDVIYAQVWNLLGHSILGRCAPLSIPPGRKAEIIPLRKKFRRRIARQNRDLEASDLLLYADEIRVTYLNIRDALYAPLRLTKSQVMGLLHSMAPRGPFVSGIRRRGSGGTGVRP